MPYNIPSNYDPEVDYERLRLSAEMHKDQDEKNIRQALKYLIREKEKDPPFRVLDAGTGYGLVTYDRFGQDSRFDVLAIDNVEDVIDKAIRYHNAENIKYRVLDVTKLPQSEIGEFDLVFASYLFHHLDPKIQENVLRYLWSRVREPGALIVRSCDDGQYLQYPPNADMKQIVEKTDNIPGSSDRTHGRRMYTQMKNLSPEPNHVELNLENYHTAGKNPKERAEYFDVFHSNRLHYVNVIAQNEDANEKEKRFYKKMANRMSELRDKFINNEKYLDAKSVPVAIAYK